MANSRQAARKSPPRAARKALVPASPPTLCDNPTQHLKTWEDPITKQRFICWCPELDPSVCGWALLLPQLNPSTWIDVNSDLYMDVANVSRSNAALIHQWTYTGANNQLWQMEGSAYGEAWHQIVSVNSGRCLGINGGATNRGANAMQWDCNGNPDQAWIWMWTGGFEFGWPTWNIVNRNSGLSLGIQGGSTALGANAIQWDRNGHLDQEWF